MAENTDNTQAGQQQTNSEPPKVKGIGKIAPINRISPSGDQTASSAVPTNTQTQSGKDTTAASGSAAGQGANDGGGSNASPSSASTSGAAGAGDQNPNAGSGDQGASGQEYDEAKALAFLKSKGIDVKNVDELKPKTADKPKTDDEKKLEESQREKRMLDKFLARGGSLEQFMAYKAVANAQLAELSDKQLRAELESEGKFDKDEIDQIIKERYYLLSDEEIDERDDEDEKLKLKKRKDYFSKRLEGYAKNTQAKAKEFFDQLATEIDSEDLLQTANAEFASNVDAHVSALPRETKIELGKIDDKDVEPIPFKYTDEDVAKVQAILKDQTQLQKLIFKEDGKSFNIPAIFDLLLAKEAAVSQARSSYIIGGDRAVKILKGVFPARSANDVGLNGSTRTQSQTGDGSKVKGFGKVQPMTPRRN